MIQQLVNYVLVITIGVLMISFAAGVIMVLAWVLLTLFKWCGGAIKALKDEITR